MKTSTSKILFLLLLCVTDTNVKAQGTPLPYLREVILRNTVDFDIGKGIYSYAYSIKNGESSNGSIDWFEIDVSRDALSAPLDDVGLLYKNSVIEDAYRRMYSQITDRVVPVGFPELPQYGDGALSIRGTAVLSATVVRPGEELRGFVLSSRGLPGIRTFLARPLFDPSDYYPTFDEVVNPDSLADQVDATREAIAFRGWTIGPTAPPANFDPVIWCDTLISYKHQAFDLGWIKNQGIVQSLDAKLENAQAQLRRNNTTAAKNILQAFVNEVEALWKEESPPYGGTQITSEAYALLKFNAEYLISKL